MALTVFASVFSFVYELMSHHVYSPFMVGLCLIPLAGGFLSVLVHRIRRIPLPDVRTQTLHCWSILTFTIGSMLTGVFDIYGTTSAFTKYYWILGMILLMGQISGVLFVLLFEAVSGASGSVVIPMIGIVILTVIEIPIAAKMKESKLIDQQR